jgi:photosystem II stability/assembly factor-like uncharacterized protein
MSSNFDRTTGADMNPQLMIGLDQGIYALGRGAQSWEKIHGSLIDHQFTAVAHQDGAVLAGTKDGLYLSFNSGKSWREANDGLTHRHIRSVSYHPEDPDLAFAGTEPAAIFVSRDKGETWQECPEVARLREKYQWSLPYSPNAGCVRGFAFQDSRGYAAVEVGGLLRSNDHGRTWHLLELREDERRVASPSPWIHIDVHSVLVHPSSSDHIFAPTGGGLYTSTSGGRSWSKLHDDYCRAVWVDPERSSHIILGTALGPDLNGQIEESIDGGQTWVKRMDGMEPVWPNFMVEEIVQLEDQLFAVLSNGGLIAASIGSLEWHSILPHTQGVRAVSILS